MGVAAAFGRWRTDRAAAREYENLAPEERNALARDLGLAEDRLSLVVSRGSQGGEELPRLLQAVRADIREIGRSDPDLLRDMQITCSTCAAVKGCRRHLDRGVARLVYQGYCPNAEAIAELSGATRPQVP